MTPKEKAIELYNKFYDSATVVIEMKIKKYVTKECALMAVDEILFEFAKNEELYHKLRFWLEVKIEIESL